MARIKQGFLGNASGKLGTVVFSKWRRLYTARQYQPDIQDANSPDQQKQRNRMVALLDFLKPLNKTFIRNFNAPYVKTSTPWAKAIKDNMPAVSPDGCILLKNFILGDPSLPQLNILEVTYNPFIDQIQLKYQLPPIPGSNENFPYIGISALGKYKTQSGENSFDVRHLVCAQPEGSWYCLLSDEVEESFYLNWWEGGRLWLLLDEQADWKVSSNPFLSISQPAYFEPVSIIEGFNTRINEDIVPVKAISWEFKFEADIWYLDFSIDFSKTKLTTPSDYTLIVWAVGFIKGGSHPSGPQEWDLQESTYEVILGEEGMNGSGIMLYAIFDKNGIQVSRFNRIYMDKGSDGTVYPFFDQLFKCNYSHPSSFLLSGNECGFCGNIDELFSDFIELWDQGVIHSDNEPEPQTEYGLKIVPPSDGTIHTADYNRVEDDIYFFDIDSDALLVPMANDGFAISAFSGPDAADVVQVTPDVFTIRMDKARELSAAFIPK